MIRLNKINNIDNFLNLTTEMRGDVLIDMPDGSKCSLRENNTARQMLRMMPVENAELCVTLSDKHDLPVVLRFLMEDVA